MTDMPRRAVYVWVSWLTSLLSGADVCQWKTWYRSHYTFEKRLGPDDGKLDAWRIAHDEMVRARVPKLRADGFVVQVEEQNAFKVRGRNGATVAGKPDIVVYGIDSSLGHVIDCKSGSPRDADAWQVRVYLWAFDLLGHTIPSGEVEYAHGSRMIGEPTPGERERIAALVRLVSGPTAPPRQPSPTECRFCEIAACPDRIEMVDAMSGETEEF